MATIVVISVSSIFMGSVSAYVNPTNTNSIGNEEGIIGDYTNRTYTVLIGETLKFTGNCTGKTILGRSPDSIEGSSFGTATASYDTASQMSVEGTYYVDIDNNLAWTPGTDVALSVKKPIFRLELKAKEGTTKKTVSSITQGTDLILDLTNNLFDDDYIDVIVIGPDGRIHNTTGNFGRYKSFSSIGDGPCFDNITIADFEATYGADTGIFGVNTTGWTIGTYTFQIKTKASNARGLNVATNTETLVIKKATIDIEAAKTSVIQNEIVKLTVTGKVGDKIQISAPKGEKVI